MNSFDELKHRFPFVPIRDCPGRYVLKGGPDAALDTLVRSSDVASIHLLPNVRDRVWIVPVAGGGLISYEKPDGLMVHTLGDEAGFARRVGILAVNVDPTLRRSGPGSPALFDHRPRPAPITEIPIERTGGSTMRVAVDFGEVSLQSPIAHHEYVIRRVPPQGESLAFLACDALLDAVLNACAPGPEGWSPLLRQYHVDETWDDTPWVIPSVGDVVAELEGVSEGAVRDCAWGEPALRMLRELLVFLRVSDSQGATVTIEKR